MISTDEVEHLQVVAERLRSAKERVRDRALVHDINNALTLVVVLREAARDDEDDDEETRTQIAADVRRALTRADSLLWQLASLAA